MLRDGAVGEAVRSVTAPRKVVGTFAWRGRELPLWNRPVTVDELMARVLEAFDTMWRGPAFSNRDYPEGLKTGWPAVLREFIPGVDPGPTIVRAAMPDPAAIDRCDAVFDLLYAMPRPEVWWIAAYAVSESYQKVADHKRCTKATARKKVRQALSAALKHVEKNWTK